MTRLSLRARMAIVFGVLITGVAVFMIEFFPARMAEQAQASAELRALTVTQVMASAVAPALEFDDAENAARVLRWLDSAPDARFAVLVDDQGKRFAVWCPEHIPAHLPLAPSVVDGELLVTSASVVGRAGGRGKLYVGQSLDRLVALRNEARETAVTASVIVLVICLLACIVIATALVRPLERLTTTARDIARGVKPPKIAGIAGGREVVAMTTALGTMLDRLNEANRQLVEASRHAGMAEVATGVLHNVGNILNSVNVGIETIHDRVSTIPADRVRRAGELLAAARAAGAEEKLDAGFKYLTAISEHLDGDRTALLAELAKLRDHVAHINRVITMQNGYARNGGVNEQVDLATLVAEAVALGCPDPGRHAIEVVQSVPAGTVTLDRHRVLQIVVNLLANARDSVTAHKHAGADVRITVRGIVEAGWLELSVEDTGGGIAPESLLKIFHAGFTTKPKGHGYGLHSSALAAEQLGGTLQCTSSGLGHGARFVLRIPIEKETSK